MVKVIEHGYLQPIETFMDIEGRIFPLITSGYCLWVGTGITQHIAQFGDTSTLSWGGLVAAMEKKASISVVSSEFAERLQAVYGKLPYVNVQQELRKLFLIPLSEAILKLEELRVKNPHGFKRIINPIMKLGLKANTIVNFNIESFSSILLAFTYDYRIKSFKALRDPKERNAATPIFRHTDEYGNAENRHIREIIHPHGSLEESGTCVLKSSDYGILSSTLGFEVAIHSAFLSPLVIVGMSLQDEYLCDQLTKYRGDIHEVLWFVVEMPSDEKLKWAERNMITVVKFDSPKDLWECIHETSHIPKTSELLMNEGWKKVVHLAKEVIEGREQIRRDMQNPEVSEEMRELLRMIAIDRGIIL